MNPFALLLARTGCVLLPLSLSFGASLIFLYIDLSLSLFSLPLKWSNFVAVHWRLLCDLTLSNAQAHSLYLPLSHSHRCPISSALVHFEWVFNLGRLSRSESPRLSDDATVKNCTHSILTNHILRASCVPAPNCLWHFQCSWMPTAINLKSYIYIYIYIISFISLFHNEDMRI